jgi:hypothetical protein
MREEAQTHGGRVALRAEEETVDAAKSLTLRSASPGAIRHPQRKRDGQAQ